MKYLLLRCEDEAPAHLHIPTLLEGAKTSYLLQLAQAGAAGRIRWPDPGAIDRFALHQALLGLEQVPAGRCYAAGANVQLGPEETAWCCDLVTQQDGRILDPTAGRISTNESRLLIQALDQELGSELRRWELGLDGHHVFVTSDPTLTPKREAAVPPAGVLVGQLWAQHLSDTALGDALRALVNEAQRILEPHPVNRVRVDLGENPANLMWLWGGAPAGNAPQAPRHPSAAAVLSKSFIMRGMAREAGWSAADGLDAFDEPAVRRCASAALTALERHDLVYVHAQVRSADPVERLCAMERIDQLFVKPLVEALPTLGAWRLLAAIDARDRLVPFIAIGTGLPQQPVQRLTSEGLASSPLAFDRGAALRAWLLGPA